MPTIPNKESIKVLEGVRSDINKLMERLPSPMINYIFLKIEMDGTEEKQVEQWNMAIRAISSILLKTMSAMSGKDYYEYTLKDFYETINTVIKKLKEREMTTSEIFMIFGDEWAGEA